MMDGMRTALICICALYRLFQMNYFHVRVVQTCRMSPYSPLSHLQTYAVHRNGIDWMIVNLKNPHLLTVTLFAHNSFIVWFKLRLPRNSVDIRSNDVKTFMECTKVWNSYKSQAFQTNSRNSFVSVHLQSITFNCVLTSSNTAYCCTCHWKHGEWLRVDLFIHSYID